MSDPRDLTDDRWALLEPVFKALGQRGRTPGGREHRGRAWIVVIDTHVVRGASNGGQIRGQRG